ncbi:MAG: DUF1254 domain-containing protein [Phenylobacterium sp.]|nr:DUF1254 domain-containing protein [Phenylobacterium sp.]
MAGTRGRAFRNGLVANRFRHVRKLTDARSQTVTQPNNDTLYSSAWLDLSAGPVRITLPDAGERYVSLALMDMFTNNFAVLHAGTAHEVIVIGPHAPGRPGAIRAPTNWVWALGRTLVAGPADLPAAHLVQDGLVAEGASDRRVVGAPLRTAPWPEYFAGVQALLADTPPPSIDGPLTAARAAGLTAAGAFDPRRFSPEQGAQIAAGLADALEIAGRGDEAGERRGGWLYPKPNLGRFGDDHRYRAQIALSGLAALPVNEALYLRALSPDGRGEIDSRRPWKLTLRKGALPPVDGFWSLTIYEVTPQGQAFLIDNPLQRYAIGDRSPELAGAKGDVDILISPDAPAGGSEQIWLPAPRSGRPFLLSFRAYRPKPAMLHMDFRLPELRPA